MQWVQSRFSEFRGGRRAASGSGAYNISMFYMKVGLLLLLAAQFCAAKVNCKKELSKYQSLDGLKALLPECPTDKAWIEARIAEREQTKKDAEEGDRIRKEVERLEKEGMGRRYSIFIRHPAGQSVVFVGGKNITVKIKDQGNFAAFGAPNYVAVNLGDKDSPLGFAIIADRLVHIRGKGKIVVDGKDEVLLTEDGWESISGKNP